MTAPEIATPVAETGVAFPLEPSFPVQLAELVNGNENIQPLGWVQELRQELPGALSPFINQRYAPAGTEAPPNYYRFLELIKRGELRNVNFDFDNHSLILRRVLNPHAVRSAVAYGTRVLSSSGCTVYPIRRINFY